MAGASLVAVLATGALCPSSLAVAEPFTYPPNPVAWVVGPGFSMADCAAAPALFYTGTVQSFPPGLTHLRAYFDRLMERPSVQRVMIEAKPYFQFYPFVDAIPKRFL